jgi:hypothetical protein
VNGDTSVGLATYCTIAVYIYSRVAVNTAKDVEGRVVSGFQLNECFEHQLQFYSVPVHKQTFSYY